MRELYIGIDSGTQSTKSLVVDGKNGKVLGSGQRGYGLIKGLAAGAKEQHPETWKKATAAAIKAALKEAKASAAARRALPPLPAPGTWPGFDAQRPATAAITPPRASPRRGLRETQTRPAVRDPSVADEETPLEEEWQHTYY